MEGMHMVFQATGIILMILSALGMIMIGRRIFKDGAALDAAEFIANLAVMIAAAICFGLGVESLLYDPSY